MYWCIYSNQWSTASDVKTWPFLKVKNSLFTTKWTSTFVFVGLGSLLGSILLHKLLKIVRKSTIFRVRCSCTNFYFLRTSELSITYFKTKFHPFSDLTTNKSSTEVRLNYVPSFHCVRCLYTSLYHVHYCRYVKSFESVDFPIPFIIDNVEFFYFISGFTLHFLLT